MKQISIIITNEKEGKKEVVKLDDFERSVLKDALEEGIESYDEANRDFGDEEDMVEVPEILRVLAKKL